MPVLMMINLKGGVAKTTTAIAVAECLATMNYRTLVIDADHQSTVSSRATPRTSGADSPTSP